MEKYVVCIPNTMQSIPILPILNNLLLAFLLFLFVREINATNVSQTYLKYNIPTDDRNDRYSGQRAVERIQQAYAIKTLQFTGNENKDDHILKTFATLLQTESRKKEATIIYRVYIPKEVTYSRFISLLNLMQTEGYKRYFEWDNYFYVFTNNNKFTI
ncbi:MAG: hypothetical protein GXC73_18205 [Chitinophagaceae bacterium]|nr:hypothetical protein [Chitinophagaceae bacterium]